MVRISASFADGTRLEDMSRILQERMRWMRETARDSIAATAITVLKSLRTITKVARPASVKVDVQPVGELVPSWTSRGGRKRVCLRHQGAARQKYTGAERIACAGAPIHISAWHVYRFTNSEAGGRGAKYLIVAPSQSAAKRKARELAWGRAKRYAGLARRALGMLMGKVYTRARVADAVPRRVTEKARQVTATRETIARSVDGSGGNYALSMDDELRYALSALKGGRAAVDTQLKKAMNKTVSIINRKMPDGSSFFGKRKLPTPFPEVANRGKAND